MEKPVPKPTLIKRSICHECLSSERVFERFKCFQDSRDADADDSSPGRPSTSKTDKDIEKNGNLIRSEYRLSTRAIAETVGVTT